jgi:hypothetical protein
MHYPWTLQTSIHAEGRSDGWMNEWTYGQTKRRTDKRWAESITNLQKKLPAICNLPRQEKLNCANFSNSFQIWYSPAKADIHTLNISLCLNIVARVWWFFRHNYPMNGRNARSQISKTVRKIFVIKMPQNNRSIRLSMEFVQWAHCQPVSLCLLFWSQ